MLEQAGITVLVREAVPERVTVVYTVDAPPSAHVGFGDAVDDGEFEPDGETVVVAPELGCELCVLEQAGITVLVREAVPERVTVV